MKREKIFATALDASPTVHKLVKSHNEMTDDLDHIDQVVSKLSLMVKGFEKDLKAFTTRQREMN